MRVTKNQLRRIIREEKRKVLAEAGQMIDPEMDKLQKGFEDAFFSLIYDPYNEIDMEDPLVVDAVLRALGTVTGELQGGGPPPTTIPAEGVYS
jgi:hypothetical protein